MLCTGLLQGYGASAALNGVITRHASPAATVRLSGPATSVYALEQAVLAYGVPLLLASILQPLAERFRANDESTPPKDKNVILNNFKTSVMPRGRPTAAAPAPSLSGKSRPAV